jgi:hypothetical protein
MSQQPMSTAAAEVDAHPTSRVNPNAVLAVVAIAQFAPREPIKPAAIAAPTSTLVRRVPVPTPSPKVAHRLHASQLVATPNVRQTTVAVLTRRRRP